MGIHQYTPSDQRQQQDSEKRPHQSNVDPHVAIEDVAEFVRDHTLQFVSVEFLQCTPGDCHRRVGWRVTCRKGIDSRLLFEHVNFRNGHSGRQGDFFDHIA